MSKDRRLGRGLAALLGTPLEEELAAAHPAPPAADSGRSPAASTPAARGPAASAQQPLPFAASPPPGLANQATPSGEATGLVQLPIHEVEENPFQPRRDFSEAEIVSLAESLKEHDLLQPILVRRVGGRYQLISGERRLRAAKHAGWTTIPARIREADDRLVAELAIVENLQRKDLNPVEKALSFKRYLDEHRCPQEDLAKRLKIDRSTIANLMRLLELPGSILDGLRSGTISAGHARALLPLGDEHEQVALAEQIARDGLSVRDVERIVADRVREEDGDEAVILPGPGKAKAVKSEQVAALEQEIRHALGVKVKIRANARGRGQIVLHFQSHDEFERLRDHLTDAPSTRQRTAG